MESTFSAEVLHFYYVIRNQFYLAHTNVGNFVYTD